ncbi:hypothetical protein STEG23_025330, partial [Scotinomys teguina]
MLSSNLLGLQHQIGTTETSSLMDCGSNGLLASRVKSFDVHRLQNYSAKAELGIPKHKDNSIRTHKEEFPGINLEGGGLWESENKYQEVSNLEVGPRLTTFPMNTKLKCTIWTVTAVHIGDIGDSYGQ